MYSVTTSVDAAPLSALIRVRGEVDLLAAPELRQAASIVIDGGCRDAVLDLNDVSFLDCAGLEALLSCRDRIEASGGRLLLGPTSRAVTRLLAMTHTLEGWAVATDAGPERTRRRTGRPRRPNGWDALPVPTEPFRALNPGCDRVPPDRPRRRTPGHAP